MQAVQEEFNKAYQQLNPEQKQAVDAIEGPVMVVAGPGTGKTQVLTARIANILQKTDTDPSAILALTFTDSAAKHMRKRLVDMIGKTGYYVHINTFHSFCSQVIKENPQYFPIERDSQPLTELERYDLFEELIDQAQLKKIKPLNAPYYFLRDIVAAISNLKREGVSPDEFEDIIQAEVNELEQQRESLNKTERRKKQRDINKHQDLLQLYRAYQQQLREKQRFDFDDMIALVVEAFTTQELLLQEYQERLHYFLVDEYQDTNTAQNKVVDLLASYWAERGGQANVFVVGDPNQSIYRFQGASVENMLGFVNRYQQAKVIALDKGYRCPQKIYDQASHLISHNQLLGADEQADETSNESSQQSSLLKTKQSKSKEGKLPSNGRRYQQVFGLLSKTLDSAQSEAAECEPEEDSAASSDHRIKIFQAPVQTLETVYVAEEIKQLIARGVNPAQIAVLYRYNSDEELMSQALDKWGIRYEIDGGDDLLKSELINQLLSFFQVLLDLRRSEEDETLFAVMQYDWFELDSLSVMKLGRIAGKERASILDILDFGYNYLVEKDYQRLLSEPEFEQIARFRSQLYDWSQQDLSDTFTHWFEVVLRESGFIDWMQQQPHKIEILNQINSLYNEVKSLVNQDHQFKLADFMRTIEVMREHRLKINVEDLNIRENAVHLSTVHKAKGQEWDYVFVIHCVDKKWGNRQQRELLPLPEGILQNTDLSQKERNEDERRVFYVALTRAKKQVVITYPETVVEENRTQEKFASQFLSEISEAEQVESQELIDQAEQHLEKLISPQPQRLVRTEEKKFFQKIVAEFKLSVTALNTYLRDRKEFVENTLLRVPRAKPQPMVFGTAVHKALEKMYSSYHGQEELPPEQFLLDQFKQALKQEVLTESEFSKLLKHGQEVLANYYQQTKEQKPDVMDVERFFGSGWSRTILDENIYLTGRIDRVDWIDRAKKTVRVIDYKTGKNKSKNHIEGKTKSAGLSEREQQLPDSIKGPYKRQLLFYKLLTQLDRTFTPTVEEGMFDFVEPFDKHSGRLKPRCFKLEQGDVNDLKDLIREVMEEIRSLNFLQEI